MKNKINFILLALLQIGFFSFARANSDIVSQPSDCLVKQKVPCTLKSLKRQSIQIGETQVVFLKDAITKIINFEQLSLEPVIGGFVIESSKVPVMVHEIKLEQFPSYANLTKDQVEIIDGKDFYTIAIAQSGTDRYLLDRDAFVRNLAYYYDDIEELRSKFKDISVVYKKSFKQDLVLQKKILTRKIASVQDEKDKEAERQKHLREQQKRYKEILFKRTFAR